MKTFVLVLVTGAAACSTGVQAPRPPEVMTSVSGETHDLRGIRFTDVTIGNGRQAANGKCLYVHYTAFLSNGNRVESSHDGANEPVAFVQGAHIVVQGWETGMEGMRTGGKRRLFIPSELAYGDAGRAPTIPPHANLTFDVELVNVAEALDARRCPKWRDIR